ncbi:DUF1801 domain-containing protein [Chitinophaga sp. 212800010-3]|uniref:DUF1801 domain-containing protein n=1 Tax=unclassified Chitinophaga TaxID=2619133 RepID=UPI002DEC21A0|nr:DUF1801 domain-containing protein [Chitinophaga sp. 212800010-3]
MEMTFTATQLLAQYDDAVGTLGMELRAFLLRHLPGIVEFPDAAARVVGYGYGTGYTQMICTIIPSKKGIKLGFYKGRELPDPGGLLSGSGKVHAYAAIRSADDLAQPALLQLLEEAVKAYKQRTKK